MSCTELAAKAEARKAVRDFEREVAKRAKKDPKSFYRQLLFVNMASKLVRQGVRQVKPILSLDNSEARRRVLNLYKAWYRQIPSIVLNYDVPLSVKDGQVKLRELFRKNKNVTDLRAIDLLVVKGQMELVETVNIWKTKGHIMRYFTDSWKEKPTDFLSKFYSGHE